MNHLAMICRKKKNVIFRGHGTWPDFQLFLSALGWLNCPSDVIGGSRILVVSSTCMALHGFENREAQSLMVYHHFSHYIKDVNSPFEGKAI